MFFFLFKFMSFNYNFRIHLYCLYIHRFTTEIHTKDDRNINLVHDAQQYDIETNSQRFGTQQARTTYVRSYVHANTGARIGRRQRRKEGRKKGKKNKARSQDARNTPVVNHTHKTSRRCSRRMPPPSSSPPPPLPPPVAAGGREARPTRRDG